MERVEEASLTLVERHGCLLGRTTTAGWGSRENHSFCREREHVLMARWCIVNVIGAGLDIIMYQTSVNAKTRSCTFGLSLELLPSTW